MLKKIIEFLEYEEALTTDPNTASRIRMLLYNLKIWEDGKTTGDKEE